MPYLVDSDVVIDHLGEIPEASPFLDRFAQEGIVISIVTYMEAYQGVIRSEQPADHCRNSAGIRAYLSNQEY